MLCTRALPSPASPASPGLVPAHSPCTARPHPPTCTNQPFPVSPGPHADLPKGDLKPVRPHPVGHRLAARRHTPHLHRFHLPPVWQLPMNTRRRESRKVKKRLCCVLLESAPSSRGLRNLRSDSVLRQSWHTVLRGLILATDLRLLYPLGRRNHNPDPCLVSQTRLVLEEQEQESFDLVEAAAA